VGTIVIVTVLAAVGPEQALDAVTDKVAVSTAGTVAAGVTETVFVEDAARVIQVLLLDQE
jgi:hypothetical protein